MKKSILIIVVIATAGAFLKFTAPGHSLLANVGLATACDGGSCN